jgi:broad specificity phosphatase PhoE
VAHGGTLGVLMTVLLDLPLHTRSSFKFANCGITRITRTRQRTTLDIHNLVVWDERVPELATSPVQSDRLHDGGESHLPRS